MAPTPEQPPTPSSLSPGRLWAEQLAMGLGLAVLLLAFMAFFHPHLLAVGAKVLTSNDMGAYGWWAVLGVVLQMVVHETGSVLAARMLRLPWRLRFFPFGAHAMGILKDRPRQTWTDAVIGFAGPLAGAGFSAILAAIYDVTDNPLFLGMACVGYFYNLATLVPILDLEGGWIAPAISPQAWLLGLVACALELTHGFNLVLLLVCSFALPRLFLLISARAPRADLVCTPRQRLFVSVTYFAVVIALAWFGSTTFETLPSLVRDAMGD